MNVNTHKLGFSFQHDFFDEIIPIIVDKVQERLLIEGLKSEVGYIERSNAVEYDKTSTGLLKPILSYKPLFEFYSEMTFKAPVSVPSSRLSPGFLNPFPVPQKGQRTPSKSLEYMKKNEEFRTSIGITPEIENIIDSTRLEHGTCQICGRIMKMIVSGENTNRFLNEKGTIVRHNSIDVPGKECPGTFRLPYELSREYLKKYIADYKSGKIVKPVNPVRLAELESSYVSWRFKDPTKTPWGVSKPKAKQRTMGDFLNSWQKKLDKDKEKLKTSPATPVKPKAPPVVKRTPAVKAPPVVKTPAVKLSVNESLFSNSLAYLNADFDLYNLQPQEAIYVVSELKPITDKLPGSAKPATSKGGLPLLWVNKLIAELKELSRFYDLGDLEDEEVKAVIASLKPILDKMPVTFTNKKAMWLGFKS
jgi:hypothetical protein